MLRNMLCMYIYIYIYIYLFRFQFRICYYELKMGDET